MAQLSPRLIPIFNVVTTKMWGGGLLRLTYFHNILTRAARELRKYADLPFILLTIKAFTKENFR